MMMVALHSPDKTEPVTVSHGRRVRILARFYDSRIFDDELYFEKIFYEIELK